MRNKFSIEIHHADEPAKSCVIFWWRKVFEACNLLRQRKETFGGNSKSKEIDFRNAKGAFLERDVEIVLA